MADRDAEALLSNHCLTAPLHPNPQNEMDNIINSLRLKYRTYTVEFDVNCGVVMLPGSFDFDFGDQIDHYATLVDTNNNEFEVERLCGCIFLTKGFAALRDFYDISLGAWMTLVFVGFGRFRLKKLISRIKKKIYFPLFDPPMKFDVEKTVHPEAFFNGFPLSIQQLSYRHDLSNFNISYENHLSASDINSGFLMLPYTGFCEHCLKKRNTTLALIDDNGNKCDCTVVVGSLTQAN